MARDLQSRGWNSTGFNLSSRGFPSSTSGFKASGPMYNQGVTGLKTNTNNGVRTLDNTGSSGGSLRGRASSRTGNAGNAYAQLLAAYQGNGAGDYYDQMKAMAQSAYDEGMAALEAAYGEYMGALGANLESTKGTLADSYGRSKKSIQDDAAQSLKQAYINKMKSERNIDQQLSAQGLSGGASETTRAGMINNYGNARNEINTTTNNNLSQLEGEYNEQIANAMSAYNQAVANAALQKAQQQIQMKNALANNQIAALEDYMSLMQDDRANYMDLLDQAIKNGADFGSLMTPTSASNTVNQLEFQMNNPMGGVGDRTSNNLMQALASIMGQNGNPAFNNTPLQNNYLAQILAQLR